MSSVENRIVNLEFNATKFIPGVTTALSALKKLNDSLKFQGGSKGLQDIQNETGRLNFGSLQSSLDTISGRFSTLGVIGTTALVNIANQAVNTGLQMAKSLTIDPISQGFQEYELKMGSVQTIMNSSGESLETVNKALGELNDYADRTIYSFSDMTNNIGKFTNAGVSLDDAVAAIQGVSNVAALSGANAENASHAMYNFAQALSSGSVRLADWKSIEVANMATMEFKEQLIQTAVEMGTLRKEGDKYVSTTTDMQGKTSEAFDATERFNDSLSSQWMTSDVLVATLGKYSDTTTDLGKRAADAAQDIKTFSQMMDTLKEEVGSGWAQTFEILFGDFEEAKDLWTSLSDGIKAVLVPMAEFRNQNLQVWKDLGGREALINGLANVFKFLGSVLEPVARAFGDVMHPLSQGERLYSFSAAFEALTSKLTASESVIDRIYQGFHGLFSVLKAVFKVVAVFGAVAFEGLKQVYKIFKPVISYALTLFARIGDLADQFYNLYFSASSTADGLSSVADRMKRFVAPLKDAWNTIKEIFSESGFAASVGSGLKALVNAIKDVLSENQVDLIGGIGDFVSSIATALDGFLTSFHIGNLIETLFLLFAGGEILGILKGIKNLFSGITEVVSGVGDAFSIFGNVADAVEEFSKVLSTLSRTLNALTLTAIAGAIYLLAKSLVEISNVEPSRLKGSVAAITMLLGALIIAMNVLGKANTVSTITKPLGIIQTAFETFALGGRAKLLAAMGLALMGLAGAIFILAKAVEELSSLNLKQIAKGLGSVLLLLAGLTAAGAIMAKTGVDKTMLSIGVGLLGISVAIFILVKAMKNLAEMDMDSLRRGGLALLGLAGGVVAMVYALSLIGKIKGVVRTALGIAIIAGTMLVLIKVVQELNSLSWDEILNGAGKIMMLTGAIGTILTAMSVLSKGTGMIGSAAAIFIVAYALSQIVEAVAAVGAIDAGTFQQSAEGLLEILSIISIVLIVMGLIGSAAGAGFLTAAISLGVVSLALNQVASALSTVASIDSGALQTATQTLADAIGYIGLVILAVGALGLVGGSVIGAAAGLLAASVAVIVVAGAIKVLAGVPADQAKQALVLLASGLGIMLAAGVIGGIPIVSQGLISLAAACLLVGAGVFLAGAGMLILATGLKILTTISPDSFTGLAEGLTNLSKGLDEVDWATMTVVGGAAIVLAAGVLALGVAAIIFGAGAIVLAAGLALLAGAFALIAGADFSAIDKINNAMANAEVGTMLGFSVAAVVLGAASLILAVGLLAISGAVAVMGMVNFANLTMLSTVLAGMNPVTILAIGGASLVLGAGLLVAGAGLVVFGAGLTLVGVGLSLVGTGLMNFIAGMQVAAANIGPVIQSIKDGFASFIEGFDFSSLGSQIISTLTGGAYSNIGQLAGPALGAIKQFASSILSNMGISTDSGKSVISGVLEAMGVKVPSFSEIGSGLVETVGSAISGAVGSLTSAARSAMEQAKSAFAGKVSSFMSIGSNIVDGIVSGVAGAAGRLISSLTSLATDALNAAKSKLGIASPSKVFAKEVGRWIPEGTAVGVDRYSKVAQASVAAMASNMVDTTNDTLSQLGKYDGFYATSTFTPVVNADDLSNMSGILRTEGAFAEGSIRKAIDAVDIQNGNLTDANIVAELQALRKDVSALQGNNYNLSMNGITINDKDAMAQATEDYLLALSRIGGMNFG